MMLLSGPPICFQLVILPVKIPFRSAIEISVSGFVAFT